MRYVSVAWLLPLLLFSHVAEAARISFVSGECGTPPVGELEIKIDAGLDMVSVLNLGGAVCPQDINFVPGAVTDEEGDPLYGNEIDSIQFFITALDLPLLTVGIESEFDPLLTLTQVTGGFLLTADFAAAMDPISVCPPAGTVALPCIPEILIGFHDLEEYPSDAIFKVVAVNGVSTPEPATLSLLGLGAAVALVRKRRPAIAKKSRMSTRGTSAPDTAHRT